MLVTGDAHLKGWFVDLGQVANACHSVLGQEESPTTIPSPAQLQAKAFTMSRKGTTGLEWFRFYIEGNCQLFAS